MAACHSYDGLLAMWFLVELFEAGCLRLSRVITSQWYRRAEQPSRRAARYGTNGAAPTRCFSSLLGTGAHLKSDVLKAWQIVFLFVGLITVVSAPHSATGNPTTTFTLRP
ncbi:hypothetical protein GJ744_000596 [Endocarpon pusillum]|uniref:Uncharacterized protein n=1 Tax=Endocarpon pusillum TaxID=364733 RepID=A0A8H7E3V7_9EURO|nr:hypothetical protein GJ744_000596 [Endocarpon pusillum]